MLNIFSKDSLHIHKAKNGFIVNVEGTRENQEDGLDGIFVFQEIGKLKEFIEEHYNEE